MEAQMTEGNKFLKRWRRASRRVERAESRLNKHALKLYAMMDELREPSMDELKNLRDATPPGMARFRIAMYIEALEDKRQ